MKITIIGRPGCNFCVMASDMCATLEDLNVLGPEEWEYMEYTKFDQEKYEKLKHDHNIKTFPIILVDGSYLGGYIELRELFYGTSVGTKNPKWRVVDGGKV